MNKLMLVALGSLVGIGLAFAVGASVPRRASAQPAVAPVRVRATAGSAPAALSAGSRTARYAAALTVAKLTPKIVAPSGVRVTPNAPRHGSGALISGADLIAYDGDKNAYVGMLGANASPQAVENYMFVGVRFPTATGTVYVLDCTVVKANVPGAKVTLRKGGANDTPLDVVDGHAVYAFTATEAATNLYLTIWGIKGLAYPEFHSCELSKVD